MDKTEVLYHGSPEKLSIISPRQANDTGFAAGCQLAVYATTSKRMAVCFAMGGVPNENGELEREMMPEHGDKMLFRKGHPDYGAKGYVYVLAKENFVHAMGSQWVSFTDEEPIEVIEINVDDYLDYCIVEDENA